MMTRKEFLMDAAITNRRDGNFLRRFLPLFGVGTLGVAALTPAIISTIRQTFAANPVAAEMPLATQVALAVVQPVLFVAASSAIGAVTAPRLGLRSHLAGDEPMPTMSLRGELPLAIALGAAASVAGIIFDLTTRPLLPPLKASGAALVESVSHTTPASILGALLYGGLTEEVMLRWGLMSLLAWLGWRFIQRRQGQPRAWLMWAAVGAAALLFGIGHLPATSLAYDLTPFVVVRALLLNGVFGLIAGWLFWRRSLESAMAAHVTYHIVLTIFNLSIAGLAYSG